MSKFKFKPNKSIDGKGGKTNGWRSECAENVMHHHLYEILHAPKTDRIDPNFMSEMTDILSNFGHYCDEHGLDFGQFLKMSFRTWEDERGASHGLAIVRYPKAGKTGKLPDVSKLSGAELLNLYADGLDASEDGRGFGGEHEAARLRIESIKPEGSVSAADKPNRVFVVVEGGNVQSIYADDAKLKAHVIDHDKGDVDDEAKEANKVLAEQAEALTEIL